MIGLPTLSGSLCPYRAMILLFILHDWTPANNAATLENINTGPIYDVVVVRRNKAELPCDIYTSDLTDRVILILWYKDGIGTPIYSYDSRGNSLTRPKYWSDTKTLQGRATFNEMSKPSALVIDEIKESDAGLYRCRVDFKKSPTRNARANLTVITPPKTPAILNESGVEVWTLVGPYDEGATLILTCEVEGGNPIPEVTWWMGNELINRASHIISPGIVNNTLTISQLTRRHLHSSLICQASNSNRSSPVQTIVTIEMNLKPLDARILGSKDPLSSGKDYELVCQSSGARPAAGMTWWLNNRQMTNVSTTTTNSGNVTVSTLFFSPKDSDGGKVLRCRAESLVISDSALEDSWQLVVYYTPQVTLTYGRNLNPEEIREKDDVYFECKIKANPWFYKVVWYHSGVMVQHNVMAGVIISNQSLVIQRVKREHTGLYTCVASNIEGDGQSNAVILKVQYAPVCSANQVLVYGAARNEEVTVVCRLDAVPPVVSFSWRFNSSGDVVDIAENHVATEGLQSSLSYVARTELDYGTLLCWGTNELGKQREPCVFRVIPAGKPDSPENCSLVNQTTETLHVKCYPGYDGGLAQTFVLEVRDEKSDYLRLNITEVLAPEFHLSGLEPGAGFAVAVYATNSKGSSDKKVLNVYTLKDVAERRTAQVRPPPTLSDEKLPLTPILAVLVGVVGSIVLVTIVAVIVVRLRKDKRMKNKKISLHLQASLSDPRDEEKNPDVVPNSESENGAQPVSTPEEGGFSGIHVCANVPYPPSAYTSLPRHHQAVHLTGIPPQNGDIMYAELAFPHQQNAGVSTLSRRNPTDAATVYAQIDHIFNQNPHTICTPLSGLLSPYGIPRPPPGYEGGQLSPPILEERVKDTSSVVDHKESEV